MKKTFFFVALLSIICVALLTRCTDDTAKENEEIRKKNLELYGCINVDDCLAKYKFSAARSLAGRSALADYEFVKYDPERKITSAEIAYYTSSNSFDRSIQSLNEYSMQYPFQEVDDDYMGKNGSYNAESDWYNSNIDKIISVLRINGQIEKAKKIVSVYYKPKAVQVKCIEYESAKKCKKWQYKLDSSDKDKLLKSLEKEINLKE